MRYNRKTAVSMALITSMLFVLFVGLSVNISIASPTTLYIDPTPITVHVCDNFTVALNVASVTDLYVWEVKLRFDPSLLECLGATQGPFLPPPTIWPPPIIDNVAGTVHMGCSRMVPPGASGSGTLAYIQFHCDGPGECDLVFLYPETYLLNSNFDPIPHEAVNGHVKQVGAEKALHGEDGLFYSVHLHADHLINLNNPIGFGIWHELWPRFCTFYIGITSWEDNGDNMLSPSDQIDMFLPTEEQWLIFWRMGDCNRDGKIDSKDIKIIQDNFGWVGPPGENPADINMDGRVDNFDLIICIKNQGLTIWTYFELKKIWWHVDDVVITITVTEIGVPEPITTYFESTGMFPEGYKQALLNPGMVTWHCVGKPWFCLYAPCSGWEDNGDGMLSSGDKVGMKIEGVVHWFNVDQVGTDIIVTRKPICTQWHEIYPEFCAHSYHLSSWIDNGNHILDYCDKIDLTDKVTGEITWWHVKTVTVTMVLTEKYVPPPIEPMYVEYIPLALSPNPVPPPEPVCTYWHEIWPVYCRYYHLTSWEDNGDGWLSPSDQIDMTDEYGKVHWYHVDDITIDIWIEPLPQPVHDVAVTNVVPQFDPSVVQGDIAPIDVTVQDQGDYPETFDVTAYATLGGPITIDILTVSLNPGEIKTLTFNWDTTGVPPGDYTISAYATPVPGETDIADNTFIDGTVTVHQYLYLHGEDGLFYSVRLHADPPVYPIYNPISTYWHELWPYYCSKYYHLTSWEDNGDKRLSPSDQIDMTIALTEEQWNRFWSMGDVNRDGYINMIDANIIAANFGWTGPPGGHPADINSDGVVNYKDAIICASNQGLDIWTYFKVGKTWWHVDDVTVTLWLSPKEPPYEPMYIELDLGWEGYDWVLRDPIGTPWHEIWPVFCRNFTLTSWIDTNGNHLLDPSDQIDMTDEVGIVTWWHVDVVTTDIIVTRKPICTQWHEIYPNFCKHDYHLTSWKDTNGDHKLSTCDIIDMTDKKTGKVTWWHVVDVTITIVVTPKMPPIEPLYLELYVDRGYGKTDPNNLVNPVCTIWHEIWPIFSRERHLSSWEDNGDGWLSPSDQIDMTPLNYPGPLEYYHVDDIMIDIIIEPIPQPCPPRVEWTHTFGPIDYFMTFCPSPAVANIDTDSNLEIITGTDEWYGSQKWHCFDASGAYQWTLPTGCDESRTSVAIADIDNDGDLEFAGGCTSGWQTQVFSHTGSFVWRYSSTYYDWWHASPAICNVNPNVTGLEVIAAEYFSGKVFCFSKTGAVLWTFQTQGTANDASPACGDIDNDGVMEVVIGEVPPSGVPHYIYAINGITGALEWKHWIEQPSTCSNRAVHSSAALADIDTTIPGLEVIFGANDGYVRCLKGTDGSLIWKRHVGGPVYSSPAVGDVDDDGYPEIVIGAARSLDDGWISCLDRFGNIKWSYATGGVISSPALANRGGVGLAIYGASLDKKLYCLDGFGNLIWSFYTGATNGITSSPAVADIDGDSKLEIMFTDWNAIPDSTTTTNVFWVLEDCTSRCTPYAIEWGMFRHDRCHTGKYSSGIMGMSTTVSEANIVKTSPEILSSTHDVAIVFDWLSKTFITAGETVQVYVDVTNEGTATENTSVTVTYDGNFIGWQNVLNLAPGETRTLTFAWDTTGVPKGTYLVTAYASTVPGETDTGDNTFSTMAIIKDPVHDIAITSVNPMKTVVGEGYGCRIQITIFNQGDHSETFSVGAEYSPGADIGSALAVTLPPSGSTTITLYWNTTGVPKGNYTISAYIITPISGETDVADNTLTEGWVFITIPGDINGDKFVNVKDAVILGVAFGSKHVSDPTDPKYCQYWHTPPCVPPLSCPHDPNADINCDGYINIKDAVIQGVNFGKSWT